MSKPKEIIELEKVYGISLKDFEAEEYFWVTKNCYVVNNDNEVTHLNLPGNQL
jgi:hypothetical protein